MVVTIQCSLKMELPSNDVLLKKDGNNLIVAIREGDKTFDELSDKVILKDWYIKK